MGDGAPSLYAWAGEMPAIERLTAIFYGRVAQDTTLAPLFRDMPPEHPRHVAQFVAEVFGGPKAYTARGGHAEMIRHHLGRHLTETQRRRWATLLMDCADEAGLPSDPEFRAALIGYIEWGSRIAVVTSQQDVPGPDDAPMPSWNWGPPGGPYRG